MSATIPNSRAVAIRLSNLDVLRVPRGRCHACEWCPKFISVSKRVLCDYCGCPPAKHLNLSNGSSSGTDIVSRRAIQACNVLVNPPPGRVGIPTSGEESLSEEEIDDVEDDSSVDLIRGSRKTDPDPEPAVVVKRLRRASERNILSGRSRSRDAGDKKKAAGDAKERG